MRPFCLATVPCYDFILTDAEHPLTIPTQRVETRALLNCPGLRHSLFFGIAFFRNRSSNCARNAEGMESISCSPEAEYPYFLHDIRKD